MTLSLPPSPFRTPEQREQDRAAKREALLRAAVRMFNERGFHATSLDDVAASLGISKPTIYHYLGNKEQVLLECVTRGLNQLLDAAAEARASDGSGAERLASFLRRYAEINMDDFGRCVIRTGDSALSPDGVRKFRALKRGIDIAMRDLIAEGIEDGSVAPVDPRMLAFTLAGALNWPAYWHSPDGAQSPEQISRVMVDLLAQGFIPR